RDQSPLARAHGSFRGARRVVRSQRADLSRRRAGMVLHAGRRVHGALGDRVRRCPEPFTDPARSRDEWQRAAAGIGRRLGLRLVGTLLSGLLYQRAGVTASLWGAVVLASAAGVGAFFLPPMTTTVAWSSAKGDD